MDVNGTDIAVEIAINFSEKKGKTSRLHLKHGNGYIQFIDDKVKGAILEGEIEEILKEDFSGNFIVFHYVEIADVNLPSNIATEITVKETQKQKNKTAKLKREEQEYIANAKIEKARGTSEALIINSKA